MLWPQWSSFCSSDTSTHRATSLATACCGIHQLADAKVCEINLIFVAVENICRFDVSVANAVLMQVPQSIEQLPDIFHRHRLFNGLASSRLSGSFSDCRSVPFGTYSMIR